MNQCTVCGAPVDPEDPPESTTFGGNTYNFCSEACQREFEQNPAAYAREAA